MNFKQHFSLFLDAVKIDRLRKIRKSFDKIDKKRGKKKFRPGTFGFDIEFDYEQDPDQTDEWADYVFDHQHLFRSEFMEWMSKEHDIYFLDMDEWDELYPGPEEVLPMDEPERDNYESDEEFDDAVDIWQAHRQDYETYVAEKEEWESNRQDAEKDVYDFERNEKDYWHDFANQEISDQMHEHLNYKADSDSKLDEYQRIIEYKLGESTQRENSGEANDYQNNWILSIDGGGQPEIASRILTTKDIPIVRKLLSHLEDEPTSNGTSAHIHIGLPDGFDTFALFALFGLVDEQTIVNRLPDRQFGNFANLSDITIRKIKKILVPIVQQNKPLWKRTVKETGYSSVVSDEVKESATHSLSVYVDKNGRPIPGEHNEQEIETYKKFLKLYRDKDVEIVGNVPAKYRISDRKKRPRSQYRHIVYKYINPDKDPIKWEPIPIVKHAGDQTILDDTIVSYIMDKIVEKFSGINISYYGQRRTIEFRYLSSQILGNIDEFLKFVEYFLRVPDIALRAKRINLDGLILRKTENGIAAQIKL